MEGGGFLSFFGRKKEGKVQFSPEAIIKCRCGVCPVQFHSVCAQPKRMTRSKFVDAVTPEMMQGMTREQISNMLPDVNNLPGPYCATGVSACKDFDFSKMCLCSACQLFKDLSLLKGKPTSYFCKGGRAK